MRASTRLRRRLSSGAVSVAVGVLSAGSALGMAELMAGLLKVRSPIIAVGDRAILLVPPAVKDVAIELFGTKDKIALLTGIVVTIALLAAGIGVAARRSFTLAAAGVVVICGVGLLAGIASTDPLLLSILPAVLGGAVGIGVLSLFRGVRGVVRDGKKHSEATPDEMSEGTSEEKAEAKKKTKPLDRRRFLVLSAGMAGFTAIGAAGGRWLTSRVNAAASRAAVILPNPMQRLSAISPGAEVKVPGVVPFYTPNATFYRIDTALQTPQIDTGDWSLRIKGMVDRPFTISFDELLDRKDFIEADVTMTCVSNTRGGELIGTARWLGVPLRNLLDEAGVDPKSATQVIGRSIDRYTCGFPTAAVYDGRTCLVAIGMNGEPLPVAHGFPARLITAGLYGYVSCTKWLTEIEMSTMEAFDSYWVPRGYAKEAPIKTQSRIDAPKSLAKVPAGPAQIAGVAWSQPRGIRRVEVQVDDGPWIEARLGDDVNGSTWRQWVADWNADPGFHSITVRATDGSGEVQTDRKTEPLPDGSSGRHVISVTVAA